MFTLKTKFPTMFHEADNGAGGGAGHQDPPANDNLENKTGGDPGTTPEEKGAGEGGEGKNLDEEFVPKSKVNEIVQKRLAEDRERREKKKAEEEAEKERQRLEEQKEYQKLADEYKKELETIKAEATEAKKLAALAKAGYSEEQIERYKRFVVGESDDEIAEAVETLVADIPPKAQRNYADPSPGNGGRDKPKPKDKVSKGRETFQRLKNAGKLR